MSTSDPESPSSSATSAQAPKLRGSEQPIAGRCGRKLQGSEKAFGHWRYCTRWPLHGKTCCKRHGGGSKAGSEHGQWKGGISPAYRKALPSEQARKIFDAVLNDPNLQSLTPEIALTRAHLVQELQEARTAASSAMVKLADKLADDWKAFESARASGSTHLVKTSMAVLERTMRRFTKFTDPAVRELDARKELRADVGLMERLQRTQNQISMDQRDAMSRSQAYALMGATTVVMLEVLAQYVPDRSQQLDARRQLAQRLAFLYGGRDGAANPATRGAAASLGPGPAEAGERGGAGNLAAPDPGSQDS